MIFKMEGGGLALVVTEFLEQRGINFERQALRPPTLNVPDAR